MMSFRAVISVRTRTETIRKGHCKKSIRCEKPGFSKGPQRALSLEHHE